MSKTGSLKRMLLPSKIFYRLILEENQFCESFAKHLVAGNTLIRDKKEEDTEEELSSSTEDTR